MRFVAYAEDGCEKFGFLDGEEIVELSMKSPEEIIATVAAHPDELKRLVRSIGSQVRRLSPRSVRWLAPIPRPASLRDAYAFRQHVETARRNRGLPMIAEFDEFPVFYFSNHRAVTGPGAVQVQQLHLDQLDYELELAVVIGKEGKNISARDADDHVFGYTIMNDWSARALQAKEMKFGLGPSKGKDFATSLGPSIVTRDELKSMHLLQSGPNGELLNASMRAYVNDKKLSEGNANTMRWTFAQLIERMSYGVTLCPGDVIGSGTVGTGCLLELNGSGVTHDLWLKPGDEVVLEVDGLGQLRNTIELVESRV